MIIILGKVFTRLREYICDVGIIFRDGDVPKNSWCRVSTGLHRGNPISLEFNCLAWLVDHVYVRRVL